MNKIVASVGLVALGASGMQNVFAQAVEEPAPSKPWNVSATLRGFYDDNINTFPNSQPMPPGFKRDSFGFEVSPTASLNWAVEQTTLSVGYIYSLKYYENKPINSTGHDDQSHAFNVSLDHAFSELYRGKVSDSFVIGQEPDFLRSGNTFSTFQRVSGDNIRNQGVIDFDAQLTPKFGLGVGYDNGYFDYADKTPFVDGAGDIFGSVGGSLNRIEQGVHLEGLWTVQESTKLLAGAQFRDIDYIADQPIAGNIFAPASVLFSNGRNSRTYRGYLGAEHAFRPDLTGAVRAGGSAIDYYNDPLGRGTEVAPYVSTSLKWTYAPGSSIEGGFEYDRVPTDVIGALGASTSNFTLDMETASVYLSINHQITPKLIASLLGQFQNNTFNGGPANGLDEQYYLAGLNLEYRFNRFLAADVGYNYDNLQSQVPNRTFDRNRVYIGVTASY